jgi:hypothetical protein
VNGEDAASASADSPRLNTLDRDALYYAAFGRFLWSSQREVEEEKTHWQKWLGRRFGSEEAGRLLAEWYALTGPISPAMQNVTATKFGNFWPTVFLQNQSVDKILSERTKIGAEPITLHQPAGLIGQIYYSQPVDAWLLNRYESRYGKLDTSTTIETYPEFERYKKRMRQATLEHRIPIPVAEYAARLEEGRIVTEAITPDKLMVLLVELADASVAVAKGAAAAAGDLQEEAHRFVMDSEMYAFATRALRHKVNAAILKARMQLNPEKAATHTPAFLEQMEGSVRVYQQLVELTQRTYYRGDREPGSNSSWSVGPHWTESLVEFENDLYTQREWIETL